jgi:hypothetical protein
VSSHPTAVPRPAKREEFAIATDVVRRHVRSRSGVFRRRLRRGCSVQTGRRKDAC